MRLPPSLLPFLSSFCLSLLFVCLLFLLCIILLLLIMHSGVLVISGVTSKRGEWTTKRTIKNHYEHEEHFTPVGLRDLLDLRMSLSFLIYFFACFVLLFSYLFFFGSIPLSFLSLSSPSLPPLLLPSSSSPYPLLIPSSSPPLSPLPSPLLPSSPSLLLFVF